EHPELIEDRQRHREARRRPRKPARIHQQLQAAESEDWRQPHQDVPPAPWHLLQSRGAARKEDRLRVPLHESIVLPSSGAAAFREHPGNGACLSQVSWVLHLRYNPLMAEIIRPVDNAPLLRHQHAGLTIEGYSRAAVQSYWRVPELKVGFDLGAQPWEFMG